MLKRKLISRDALHMLMVIEVNNWKIDLNYLLYIFTYLLKMDDVKDLVDEIYGMRNDSEHEYKKFQTYINNTYEQYLIIQQELLEKKETIDTHINNKLKNIFPSVKDININRCEIFMNLSKEDFNFLMSNNDDNEPNIIEQNEYSIKLWHAGTATPTRYMVDIIFPCSIILSVNIKCQDPDIIEVAKLLILLREFDNATTFEKYHFHV
jgi:hypothetical protein